MSNQQTLAFTEKGLTPKQAEWRWAKQHRCPRHKTMLVLGRCFVCQPMELKPLPADFIVREPGPKKRKRKAQRSLALENEGESPQSFRLFKPKTLVSESLRKLLRLGYFLQPIGCSDVQTLDNVRHQCESFNTLIA